MDKNCKINICASFGYFRVPIKKNVFLIPEINEDNKLREFSIKLFSEKIYIAEALIIYASRAIIDGKQPYFLIAEIENGKVVYEGKSNN